MENNPVNHDGLTQGKVLVMAATAGISVANIYYNQPILKDIADSFHVSESGVGNISVLTQLGYGAGLFFLIPLGDKLSRKKLSIFLLLLLSVFLIGLACATTINMMLLLSIIVGFLSVTPQILIPLAATINENSRGKTIGTIFSGLLIGILAARVLSGVVAAAVGWRFVFVISTVLGAIMSFLLYKMLPDLPGRFEGNYGALLKSTLAQIPRFGELREAAILGGTMFGVFTSFWTTLTFHLSAPPFSYKEQTIGLFGIAAIAGALMAPIVGRLNDSGRKRLALLISVLFALVSVIMMMLFRASLLAFIAAIILLDIGVQGVQVTNAARIYNLDINSSSRINTVYMTAYFIGGAVGTKTGLLCWAHGKWTMVTEQMMLWSCIALIIVVAGAFRDRKNVIQK